MAVQGPQHGAQHLREELELDVSMELLWENKQICDTHCLCIHISISESDLGQVVLNNSQYLFKASCKRVPEGCKKGKQKRGLSFFFFCQNNTNWPFNLSKFIGFGVDQVGFTRERTNGV